jgi:HSP20 family molecular chaperone IbpA
MNTQQARPEYKNGAAPEKAYRKRTFAPPVDVFENADELLVVADLPGIAVESVALTVEKGTLTLTARAAAPGDGEPQKRARSLEFEAVDYERTFRLPPGLDESRISAEAKNGTLLVHLPKAAEAKPRQVAVKAG